MGSITIGAPQPWPPPPSQSNDNNKSYRDSSSSCTPGICSFSCPQWCGYLFLPPPPPSFLLDSSESDDSSSSSHISPLMAVLIAVLAAAFLILFYYTVVTKLCRRRRRRRNHRTRIVSNPEDRVDHMVQDPTRPETGLDESFIRQITVFKYKRNDGLIEGTDCAVCLSEFKEEEDLRLMPNCEHAFHIPCIDTWLTSHSNCPLCRATMNPQPVRSSHPGSNSGHVDGNGGVSVSAMQVQRNNDVVLVIREVEGGVNGELILCHEEQVLESEEEEDDDESKGDNRRR